MDGWAGPPTPLSMHTHNNAHACSDCVLKSGGGPPSFYPPSLPGGLSGPWEWVASFWQLPGVLLGGAG